MCFVRAVNISRQGTQANPIFLANFNFTECVTDSEEHVKIVEVAFDQL